MMRQAGAAWRKAAMAVGSLSKGGKTERNLMEGSFKAGRMWEGMAAGSHLQARGSKYMRRGLYGAGAVGVANGLRSPEGSGSVGMMPQSSGGMTGY